MGLLGLNTGQRKIKQVKPGESAGNKGGKSARETPRMKSEILIDLPPCNIQFKQISHPREGRGGGSGSRRGTDAYDLVNINRPIKTRRLWKAECLFWQLQLLWMS